MKAEAEPLLLCSTIQLYTAHLLLLSNPTRLLCSHIRAQVIDTEAVESLLSVWIKHSDRQAESDNSDELISTLKHIIRLLDA